jgi:hypothetical protein
MVILIFLSFLLSFFQAESGDFNPVIHTREILKARVSARFPNPIRNRMKALCSSTMSGNGLGDELAARVQGFYARVSGKTKVEAQLDYLSFLRTFCPFYGSTFYEVHVQYDDSPLEESASPPVLPMMASIGPLAITLMASSADGSPIVMRHAYKRMIKWISFPDKHIFTYWIIKPNVSLADIEDYQEEHENTGIKDLDTKKFCDCVYLVTSQVKELEYLVKSYVEAVGANIEPALPGAEDELLPPTLRKAGGVATTSVFSPNRGAAQSQQSQSQSQEKDKTEFKEKAKSRVSRIGLFFNALGGGGGGGNHTSHDEDDGSHTNNHNNNNNSQNAHAGSGMNQEDTGDDIYNDDVAGIGGSLFQSVYKNMGKGSTNTNSSSSAGGKLGSVFAPVVQEDEEDSDAIKEEKIPPSIQYAASMSELKRMAEEQNFSDSSDGENDGEEEEDDDESDEDDEDEDDEEEEENGGSDSNNNEDSDADSTEELKDKKKKKEKKKLSKTNKNKNDQPEDGKSPSSMKAFKRASRILFGQFGTKQKKAEE